MHRIQYRFGYVLLLIIVAVTFTLAAPQGDGPRFVEVMLQASVFVAAMVASKVPRWLLTLSVLVAAFGIAGSAAAIFGTGEFGNGSAAVLALFYVALTPPVIAIGVYRQFQEGGAVTLHTMFGVLCLYLLIGLMFAVAFATVDQFNTGPFFNTSHAGRDDFLYFSYTTLTTVGYGDLVARTDVGRSLAITEALVGQLYLVTVVALIISNLRPTRARASAE